MPRIPLFSSLDQEHLQRLIEKVNRVELPRGKVIVRQGDQGDALFVIVRGAVEVSVDVDGQPRVVGQLGEGEFFGELALLTDFRRSATVAAAVDTELLALDRDAIAELIRDAPEVLRQLLRFFRDRLIARFTATSPLFASLTADEASALAARFQFLEFEPGQTLIAEGQLSPGLYIVLSGGCDVLQRRGAEETPVAVLGPGDMCGEMSLLGRAVATATVRARSRLWALGMPRAVFQEVIMTHPQVLIYVNEVAEQRRERLLNFI